MKYKLTTSSSFIAQIIKFILIFATFSSVFAQITVTNSTFPAIGDTLKMAFDYPPVSGVEPRTPPGGPQTWDFSSLQFDATQDIVYRAASEGNAQVSGADLFAVTLPNWEEYYNVTSNSFELVADYGSHFDLLGNTLFDHIPSITERRSPMNFFDIKQVSSGILYKTTPSAFPPTLIAALPVTADSMRYRIAINRIDAVEAFGSLTIPGGTYDVLREKRTKYQETRLDAKIPPLGWLDITDIALLYGFQGFGVDTIVTYNFYNNVEKEPIAIVEYKVVNNFEVLQQASFKLNPEALPVELTSFTALSSGSKILLNWQTATEVNNYGFEIQRKEINDEWKKLAFVNGHGNSNSPKSYSYDDNNPTGGSKIRYRLKQIDIDGKFEYSDEVEVAYVPKEFTLYQNYPNPFNPATKIKYTIPQTYPLIPTREGMEQSERGVLVVLKIYDILGKEIATLVNEKQSPGNYEVTFDAGNLPSGVYLCKIQAGSYVKIKKMMLIR